MANVSYQAERVGLISQHPRALIHKSFDSATLKIMSPLFL